VKYVIEPAPKLGHHPQYAYAPGNKRVWRGTSAWDGGVFSLTLDELTFWSVTGQKLATYNISGDPSISYSGGTPALTVYLATTNYYFGRKLIKNVGGYVGSDRLGSIGKYYPWGRVKPTGNVVGTEGFTGYFRDSETMLDYAKNRYEQPGMGRFMTPDPFMGSGGPANPGSWNRYAYVLGDPINRVDRKGLDGGMVIDDGDDDDDDDDDSLGGTTSYSSSQITGYDADGTPQVGDQTPGVSATVSTSLSSVIYSGSVNVFTFAGLGAEIGGTIGGPLGILPGALIGSMCGVGPSFSYVPSTNSLYGGLQVSCGIAPIDGGLGLNGNAVNVPPSQDPNSIANGWTGSLTFQPTPITGVTVTKSPGSGPPVAGPSFGTRVPVAVGGGYSWCIPIRGRTTCPH
jgi:RHS repeat-associated protein